jgi:hypothetical protein
MQGVTAEFGKNRTLRLSGLQLYEPPNTLATASQNPLAKSLAAQVLPIVENLGVSFEYGASMKIARTTTPFSIYRIEIWQGTAAPQSLTT